MAESHVYTGVWTNWANHPFYRLTLTTTERGGLILISFLTIFVGIVGTQIWGITCFVYHQIRSTHKPESFEDDQGRVLVRNSATPTSTLFKLFELHHLWEFNNRQKLLHIIPLVLIASGNFAVFTTLSLFSSRILNISPEVLLKRNPYCGYMPQIQWLGGDSSVRYTLSTLLEDRTFLDNGLKLARSCYGNETKPKECTGLATGAIQPSSQFGNCPFTIGMCKASRNGTLVVDSGLVDSNINLGINTPSQNSVQYRKVLSCAPLRTEGFMSRKDGEVFYHYGGIYQGGSRTSPYTTIYENGEPLNQFVTINYVPPLPIKSFWASTHLYNSPKLSTWLPIKQLRRDDADVVINLLATNTVYSTRIDDLWLHAHRPIEYFPGGSGSFFTSKQPVAPMGCTEQHQICLDSGSNCSPLTSHYKVENWLNDHIRDNDARQSIINSIVIPAAQTGLHNLVYTFGSNVLLAYEYLFNPQNLFSSALPANQWQKEVEGWMAIMLASMQQFPVVQARGPTNPAIRRFIQPAVKAGQLDICANQRIHDARYRSFSLLSLILTIVAGCILIAVNWALPALVGAIQDRMQKGLGKREMWLNDNLLQIHQSAFEAAKILGREKAARKVSDQSR